jgi:menaquinone-9 beta-reductase
LSDSSYDVVVVGAGPAGSATATLLAEAGHDVTLLDRARFPRAKACAEYVSPGGVAVLDRLGVLARIPETEAGRRLRGMALYAPDGGRYLVEYRTGARVHFGRSLSRWSLDAALVDLARARGVRVREGARVSGVERDARGVVRGVRVSGDELIRARLSIGADGLHSVVARGAGAHRTRTWPRRLGLVAHVQGVPWPEDHGQMRVGPRGYVGVAPLDEFGTMTIGLVSSLPKGRLGAPGAALDGALADYPELAQRVACGRRVGPVHGVGPLAFRVSPSAGPGYLLVGDAAGFLDPFTGEGIFRALRGAELAAASAIQALASDAADPAWAQGYHVARQHAFRSKEYLTTIIQLFVHVPWLMTYAVQRLRTRPRLGAQLGRVLGDLEPAGTPLNAGFLCGLLRP